MTISRRPLIHGKLGVTLSTDLSDGGSGSKYGDTVRYQDQFTDRQGHSRCRALDGNTVLLPNREISSH